MCTYTPSFLYLPPTHPAHLTPLGHHGTEPPALHSSFPVAICLTHGSMYIRRRQWHPTPVLLPGKSHGRRSLVRCSPGGRWGSDTTEWFHFHFSLSCIGEGNGNPLQCSCLENPRDGGAWWAAVCGVTQSQTRLKWLSSSRFIIAFLPRSKHLLISWLQSPSTVKEWN